MPPAPLTLLATVLVALAWPPAGAAAPRWRAPADGRVVARFDYTRAHPFAAGQRRGVELAAAPGSLVVAPCGGRIAFAGGVPRFGAAVSIRCRGGLVATVLDLAGTSARRGTPVLAGQPLGTVGAGGRVRLGARRAADRFGYRDPLPLLGPSGRTPLPAVPLRPTLGPAPRGGAPPRRPGVALRPAAPPPRLVRARGRTRRQAPLAAWLGAGLMAMALGAGGTAQIARRRAARRPTAAPSHAVGGG